MYLNRLIYYYNEEYRYSLSDIEDYISSNIEYITEEGLLNIFENDIGIIEISEDLKQWCNEFSGDYNEMILQDKVVIKE